MRHRTRHLDAKKARHTQKKSKHPRHCTSCSEHAPRPGLTATHTPVFVHSIMEQSIYTRRLTCQQNEWQKNEGTSCICPPGQLDCASLHMRQRLLDQHRVKCDEQRRQHAIRQGCRTGRRRVRGGGEYGWRGAGGCGEHAREVPGCDEGGTEHYGNARVHTRSERGRHYCQR